MRIPDEINGAPSGSISATVKGNEVTKSTALKVRIDLAIPMSLSDMSSVSSAAANVEKLKSAAAELGFSIASEVTAKAGTFDFGSDGKTSDASDTTGGDSK